jgi:hypothetical protein
VICSPTPNIIRVIIKEDEAERAQDMCDGGEEICIQGSGRYLNERHHLKAKGIYGNI